MNFEVLKRDHLKRNILIAVLVVALISSLILNFTQAKYRTTQSMPLIQGTINFSPSDLNIVAMYLNQGGALPEGQTDVAPKFGYTLNTEQSMCEVDGDVVENSSITYENGLLNFFSLNRKGTKCTVYFDLIPDDQAPTVSITASSNDDTSITVTTYASDNIGVYYYYYKLDNGEEIRSEEASYTFDGLEKDSIHTVTVRVVDAAGNEATDSDEVTVGLYGGDYILASDNAPTGQTTDWTGQTTYYYTGNPNNWVQFAGYWWRIIRINGDGSIRMIYQGTSANTTGTGTQLQTSAFNSTRTNNMYVGYMYTSGERQGHNNPSTIKGVLDQWYSVTSGLTAYEEYIDGNAGFCGDRRVSSGTGIGTSGTNYQPYTRISNSSPSLSCEKADIYTVDEFEHGNGALTYPIGLISADEAMFAGVPWYSNGTNQNNYLYTGQYYWTMSPYYFSGSYAFVFCVFSSGNLDARNNVTWTEPGVRPVINLRSDTPLSGSGTTSDPFVVVS